MNGTHPPLHASRHQPSHTYAEAAQGLYPAKAAPPPPDQPQVSIDQPAPPPATLGQAPVSILTGTCMSTLTNDVIDANCCEIPSIASIYDLIGSFVPNELKEKIWEGKFIDLSLLLKSARELEIQMETSGERLYLLLNISIVLIIKNFIFIIRLFLPKVINANPSCAEVIATFNSEGKGPYVLHPIEAGSTSSSRGSTCTILDPCLMFHGLSQLFIFYL